MAGLVKRHSRGGVILQEGTPGGRLHVILEGQVRISKLLAGAGEEALTILGPRDFFGEVEFFDGAPSSAHAIAHTDCEVFSIPHREVRALMHARPGVAAKFLWAFARTLSTRLRETNEKVGTLLAISRHL
jgi:CRP-like cAMP-binding protein